MQTRFRQRTQNLPNDIDPDDEYWVVEACDPTTSRVLGWATVKKRTESNQGLIDWIEVDQEHRRRGIAKELVRAIREKWPNVLVSDGFTIEGEGFVNSLDESIVFPLP